MINVFGSNFDVQGIVNQLMEYNSLGLQRLNNQKSIYEFQQKSYTDLKSKITDLSAQLDFLKGAIENNNYIAESGNENILSATTTSNQVVTSEYNINVTQVAQAHQLASTTFSDNTGSLSISGTLTIETNGQSFDTTIDSGDSLTNIRDKINQALDNTGVTASILKTTGGGGSDEYRLIVTADETGDDYALTISGDAAPSLDISTELTAAADAIFTVNGFNVESSSNTLTDVIEGVTFHLNGQTGSTTLSIKKDLSNELQNITEAMESFITDYNTVMATLSENQSDSLLRDGTYSVIRKDLQNIQSSSFGSGLLTQLYEVGIKTSQATTTVNSEGVEYVITGQIELDLDVLQEVLNNQKEDVVELFNGTDGFISTLSDTIKSIEDNNIVTREGIIDEQTKAIDDRIFREQMRLDGQRTHLIERYSEVERLIARYDVLSTFLDNQLSLFKNSTKD